MHAITRHSESLSGVVWAAAPTLIAAAAAATSRFLLLLRCQACALRLVPALLPVRHLHTCHALHIRGSQQDSSSLTAH